MRKDRNDERKTKEKKGEKVKSWKKEDEKK